MSVLTFVGGFLDVYTFMTRGGIFANTQTTNLANLGFFIANRQFIEVFRVALPILSCIFGALVSTILLRHRDESLHKELLYFEVIILLLIGFTKDPRFDTLINCTVSFITCFQLNLFRKMGALAHNTTISTGNLRQVGELMADGVMSKKEANIKLAVKYFCVTFMFVLGAVISTFATNIFFEKSIWMCSGLLLFSIYLLGYLNKTRERKFFLKSRFRM